MLYQGIVFLFPGNMRESDENLNPRKNILCSLNITHPVDKFCYSIRDRKSGQCCINLTRTVYISYDKGKYRNR